MSVVVLGVCRDFMQAMRDRVRSNWPSRRGPQLWAAEAALIEPTGITDPAWATRRWEGGLARERDHLEANCDTCPRRSLGAAKTTSR